MKIGDFKLFIGGVSRGSSGVKIIGFRVLTVISGLTWLLLVVVN